MRILITGGAGYIGSHCVISACERGHDVTVFDNLSTGRRETVDSLAGLFGNLSFVEGDLRNPDDIEKALSSGGFDVVIHLAAISQVGESVADPEKYCLNNITGTMNLLESVRRHGVPYFVFSSSASVYGEPEVIPISEDAPTEPINTYGFTKLAMERAIHEYSCAYGLHAVCLRYFNVVGADSAGRTGEWHEPETHLVPSIIRSIVEGTEFRLFGDDYDTPDGTCIRDYIDVRDVVRAHFLALDYLVSGGATCSVNLGTMRGHSVREMVSLCESVIGKPARLVAAPRCPGDPTSLIADATRAKAVLGWEPEFSLDESILSAYNWYKSRSAGSGPSPLHRSQELAGVLVA